MELLVVCVPSHIDIIMFDEKKHGTFVLKLEKQNVIKPWYSRAVFSAKAGFIPFAIIFPYVPPSLDSVGQFRKKIGSVS